MRTVKVTRLLIMTLLLIVAALMLYGRPAATAAVAVKPPLNRVLGEITGWQAGESFVMEDRIIEALLLDDHQYRAYQRNQEKVTLYIGFYRTAKKVGAAHDPLVCFTGQGWRIGGRTQGNLSLGAIPGRRISYSSMTAERQGERELILYWFQTNGTASAGTLSQKVAMVWDRLNGCGEENAFVRLSTPIGNESTEAARKRIFGFIENFYPIFYSYVTGS
jgi:EpsI family protein